MFVVVERSSSAVECRTRNRESPGSNSLFASVSKIGHFRSLRSLCCINEYLAIENGGNVCACSSRVIAARLNASQRSRVGVGMNRSARG